VTKHPAVITAGALTIALCTFPAVVDAGAGDEAKIRSLEARFAEAFNAKDVDAIMKVYVPGNRLFVFDLIPPRQYVGAQAYRKDWENLFAMFKGPVKFEISDLAITADRTLAYGHSIQHVTGTDANGHPIELTVRVTDVYRRINGQWLIEHEHVSVPVDLDSGKPDLASKP
jgi:ketosteroid isomerase-like protein